MPEIVTKNCVEITISTYDLQHASSHQCYCYIMMLIYTLQGGAEKSYMYVPLFSASPSTYCGKKIQKYAVTHKPDISD